MHSAIIAVQLPSVDDEKWLGFSSLIDEVDKDPAVQRLAHNVWQVDFQKSPAALATLILGAHRQKMAYKILPFDDEPRWISGGLGQKTS